MKVKFTHATVLNGWYNELKGALSRPFWSNCPNILQRTWFEHELLLQLTEENIKVFSPKKNEI